MRTLIHSLEEIGGKNIKISEDIYSLGSPSLVFTYMGDTFIIQSLPSNYFLNSIIIVNVGWMFVGKGEKTAIMEVINDVNKQPGYFPKIVFFEDEEKEMYGLSSNATVVFDPKISNINFHLRDLLYDFFGIQQLFKMSYAIAKKQ